ncbi:DUF1476 domain-containing protein [Martelella mediterranea]|uniref:DUF1476 domain-containing protein n=1 Tax=Martelella mediterranea TaxID=293089 RepID=A0A4R3NS80_9HYPH|nr:DUF1476 domain-containing protein [Martelella mediterranea]TCT39270.1 hypothetical protein EDC90_101311 [Martelella mediterranea]
MASLSFSDREKAFEAAFVRQEAARFRTVARRNRMLAAWAADLLGREDEDVFASEVIAADFSKAGEEDVLRKLMRDFEHAGISIEEEALRMKMHALMQAASQQVDVE